MSANPVSRARTRSAMHAPLVNTWRWLGNQTHRQSLAHRVINNADLPKSLADRIDQIVRRTRLWPTERADIARELCAHARDALDADQSTDDTLTTLGDPATVAKLLRRSAKRKRHWLWQIRHRTSQAILTTLALLLLTYAALFIRFNTGSPAIKHSAIAELNERNAGYTEDQRALPAVEDLWIKWSQESDRLKALQQADRTRAIENPDTPVRDWAFDEGARATPEHAGYEEYRAFIARIRPEIDAVARASRCPTLGGIYSDESESVIIPGTDLHRFRPIPPSPDPAAHGSMIGVLLPWLGQTRVAARLLLTDAMFAAQTGDAERAADRVEASLRYAPLTADDSFLISTLVGIAIQNYTEKEFLHILHQHPDLFSDDQLVRLTHLLSATAEHTQHINMSGERAMFEDILQRSFTDDGNGDGRLTAKGFEELAGEIFSTNPDSHYATLELKGTEPPRAAARFAGPVSLLMVASRAEHRRLYNELISIIEPAMDPTTPSQEAVARTHAFDEAAKTLAQDSERFPLIALLMPSLGKTIMTAHAARAHTNATILTIAAHLHHRHTGTWPTDADQLVPDMLPSRPLDPFDPGRTFRIRVIDDQLTVYSVGADGDDDRGTPADGFRASKSLTKRFPKPNEPVSEVPQGDWVIYPPADD